MNYDNKLKNLEERRSVSQSVRNSYIFDSAIASPTKETFLALKEPSAIRYAIGAMQPVTKRYTEICFEEGDRVANSLKASLKHLNINTTHEFQGSVPLDIHIKGVSDVDVLIFHPYVTTQEPVATHTNYTTINDGKSMLDRIKELRVYSESILKRNYPAATVDTSKAKAINMQGGSLQREVDIVPAHWHDTLEYQNSYLNSDREVKIYDKENHKTIGNWPFKHMSAINSRDSLYSGNLKKVCRLLKNLKSDAPNNLESILKPLSSYDIAGLAYHMSYNLNNPEYYDLGLVSKTNSFLLDILVNDCAKGRLLTTPDGSRKILDSKKKENAAIALVLEVNALNDDIIESLSPYNKDIGKERLKNKAVRVN